MARRCRHWGLITGSAFKSTSNGHIDRKVSTDHENWSETSFQVSLGFTIYAKGDLFITSHVLQIDSLAIWQDISLSVAWRFLHIDPETFYGRHTLQKVSKKSSSSPKWDWRAGVGHPAWKQDPSPAYRAASVRFYERAFIFLRTDFPGRFWKTSGTKRGKKKIEVLYYSTGNTVFLVVYFCICWDSRFVFLLCLSSLLCHLLRGPLWLGNWKHRWSSPWYSTSSHSSCLQSQTSGPCIFSWHWRYQNNNTIFHFLWKCHKQVENITLDIHDCSVHIWI